MRGGILGTTTTTGGTTGAGSGTAVDTGGAGASLGWVAHPTKMSEKIKDRNNFMKPKIQKLVPIYCE
jgi:hypothetical protein